MPQDHYKLKNFYSLLGLDYGATPQDIENAYQLAQALQPAPEADPIAHDTFEQVSRAYRVLSNESTRDAYNNAAVVACDDLRGEASDFRNDFAQATAGMNDLQKLHIAVTHELMDEIRFLAVRGIQPAPKTVKHVMDLDLHEVMKIFVDNGYAPSLSIVNAAADMSYGSHKEMLDEVLRAPGARLDERTLYHVIDQGRADLVSVFIDKDLKATPEMVGRAVHNYFKDPAERREAHMKVITALIDGGAIPDRATVNYAKREGYTRFMADTLSAARKPGKLRGFLSRSASPGV